MASRQDYIAVFDSGVGGISVLRQLIRLMPRERYLYFGDSANAPYGPRPVEQIRRLTLEAAEKLVDRGIKALVVACNTATAAAITTLREKYPQIIVIGIEPALKLAADHFPGGRIGVMATQATLRQEKFDTLLHRFEAVCDVTELPAPGLVELVEAGQGNSPGARALLQPILEPHAHGLDAVVLGCTHYPFAREAISDILGPEVALLEGGPGTARETQRRLEQAGLLFDGPGEVVIENSLPGGRMEKLCEKLLYNE